MRETEQKTAEILKKIRTLEIKTRGLVETAFAGDYHSVFKGRGMNFEDVREYQPGDEIRAIDWNVTARLGTAFVKPFRKPARNCSPNEGSTRVASRTSPMRRVFRKDLSTTTSGAKKLWRQRS